MNFNRHFPKTAALLEKARGEVYGSFAVGFRYRDLGSYGYGGCGESSLFDLASVSKVLSTTTLAALAEQRGLLSAGATAQAFFPTFADARVKLTHLLNHSSGLPAWLPLHSRFHDENGLGRFNPWQTPEEARAWYEREIIKSHQPAAFEKNCVYSDLGFMLLGWALEKATELPLDALFQDWIASPLATASLQYLPTSPDVVPTENCPWRGRVLRGEVHDDNTFVLGGIAGHAGLFGTIHDVVKIGLEWLNAFKGHTALLSPESARRYWTFTHVPQASRVLGWDGVSSEGSSTGQYFSKSSRGHLGYTGTSLWIDPERELVVSLLTNRVYPTRANEKIKLFRPLFHDTLLSELGIS